MNPTNKQLVKYTNEMYRIILNCSDERIAEMYSIMNNWNIPHEFKDIEPFIGLSDTKTLNPLYWKIFSDLIHKIIPYETITKIHYRDNLAPQVDWNFAWDMSFDTKNYQITYKFPYHDLSKTN